MNTTIERTQAHTEIEFDENGKQRLTHIVNCPDRYATTQEYLMESMLQGFKVEALCGHVWLPSRDPKKYPVCKPCIDEAQRIQSEVFGR